MVSLGSLWLPILLSGVFVFVVSSIIHMVLQYHAGDFKRVPNEEAVMAALRPFNLAPGEYCVPRAGSMKEMGTPAFLEKMKAGPVLLMTVMKSGAPSMTGSLIAWFVYSIVVSIFAGYVAACALGPGAHYLAVFRFVGTTAFAGYALGIWQNAIWYKRSVSTVLKLTVDGLVYACVTAGAFGWLWPS
ncbi:MAG: hypothetical protein ACKVU1_03425 [bacterium]